MAEYRQDFEHQLK